MVIAMTVFRSLRNVKGVQTDIMLSRTPVRVRGNLVIADFVVCYRWINLPVKKRNCDTSSAF